MEFQSNEDEQEVTWNTNKLLMEILRKQDMSAKETREIIKEEIKEQAKRSEEQAKEQAKRWDEQAKEQAKRWDEQAKEQTMRLEEWMKEMIKQQAEKYEERTKEISGSVQHMEDQVKQTREMLEEAKEQTKEKFEQQAKKMEEQNEKMKEMILQVESRMKDCSENNAVKLGLKMEERPQTEEKKNITSFEEPKKRQGLQEITLSQQMMMLQEEIRQLKLKDVEREEVHSGESTKRVTNIRSDDSLDDHISRGNAMVNGFIRIKEFKGEKDESPIGHIRSLQQLFELNKMSEASKLAIASNHLNGAAILWWESVREKPRTFGEYKAELLRVYWGEIKQEEVYFRIYHERYKPHKGDTYTQFYRRQVAKMQTLNAMNLMDRYVTRVIRHNLPRHVEQAIIVSGKEDIEDVAELLEGLDHTEAQPWPKGDERPAQTASMSHENPGFGYIKNPRRGYYRKPYDRPGETRSSDNQEQQTRIKASRTSISVPPAQEF